MQLTMTMITTMMLTTLVPFTKSMMSLGTMLMCTAIMTTIMTSQMINSWFAFILFLVYITGLLVLFSYMMAMSPNTYYTQKNTMKMMITAVITTTIMVMTSNNPKPIMNPTEGSKSFETTITQLFSLDNTPMYWSIGIILLVALLMAVTICYKAAKPLRSYLP